jgi:hypothetical protein
MGKMNIMKHIILAAALSLAATTAFAGATIGTKESNSNGSVVGQSSSAYTGNGDVIGGNGTNGVAGAMGGDQTTGPASRPSLMQHYGNFVGNGNAGDNAGGVGNMGSHR